MRRLLLFLGLAGTALLVTEVVLIVLFAQRAAATPIVPTVDVTRVAALSTATITLTPTASPTAEDTATPTASVTPSLTPTETFTPSITPTPAPTLTPHPATLVHVIQAGETLSSIAAQYGVTVEALMAANNLTDANLVVQGQRLFVSVLVTDTPSPTPTIEPTAEDLGILTPTATEVTPTPIPPPLPDMVVGLPLDLLILIDDATLDNIQTIYARGQEMGNDPHAFSKIGDSTIENPHFLARFDGSPYNLGDFAALQPMIDFYHGSFDRESLAVKRGMNSWVVTDPMWADPTECEPNEGPLACEIRVHRPSVVFIRLGTNDVGSDGFRDNMRQIIQYCIDHGVIPIIGTKADRYRDPYNQVNAILIEVAAEMHVPLFDFDRASRILPDHGMTDDGTHLTTFFTQDYRQGYALWTGYGLHNMLALLTLDRVWQTVTPATVLTTADITPTPTPATTPTPTATPGG